MYVSPKKCQHRRNITVIFGIHRVPVAPRCAGKPQGSFLSPNVNHFCLPLGARFNGFRLSYIKMLLCVLPSIPFFTCMDCVDASSTSVRHTFWILFSWLALPTYRTLCLSTHWDCVCCFTSRPYCCEPTTLGYGSRTEDCVLYWRVALAPAAFCFYVNSRYLSVGRCCEFF